MNTNFFVRSMIFCLAALIIVSVNYAIVIFVINNMPDSLWNAIMYEFCEPLRIHPVFLFLLPSIFILVRMALQKI